MQLLERTRRDERGEVLARADLLHPEFENHQSGEKRKSQCHHVGNLPQQAFQPTCRRPDPVPDTGLGSYRPQQFASLRS
jgi:hypothetical protein